jgi:glutamate synthase (ferredoxin)
MTADYANPNYNKAIAKGILKIMNKIGISLYIRSRA